MNTVVYVGIPRPFCAEGYSVLHTIAVYDTGPVTPFSKIGGGHASAQVPPHDQVHDYMY